MITNFTEAKQYIYIFKYLMKKELKAKIPLIKALSQVMKLFYKLFN